MKGPARPPATPAAEVFRVRTQPFLVFYPEGDRLAEEKRKDFLETLWKIEGWTEVPGANGTYIDVTATTFSTD